MALNRRQKDFKGCLRCRERRVKCDGTRPYCVRCNRIGQPCPGFAHSFIWVPTNEAISTRQGRGGLSPTSTWDGHALLNLDEVDELISKVDTLNDRSQECNESACSCFSVFDAHVISSNGFPHDTYRRLPRSLDAVGVNWEFGSRYLFHHYVNYVAPQMMPLKNDCNPWTTLYPSMACTSEGVRQCSA